jgi:threo-3-hydroxy-L-aspartate ammonia-lyase
MPRAAAPHFSPLISLADIEAAATRIAGVIRRTPLLPTALLPVQALYVKAESLQVTGSFKIRGASNAVAALREEERARGVVTHSSGNHGQALARAAAAAGVRATVVMPRQSPIVKQEATKRYGASVVLVDSRERVPAASRIAADTGAVLVPSFDDPNVIAGQGTVGLEILADLPDAATVFVPVSGGGLISGVATAVKSRRPATRVVAVEPELAADLAESFAARRRMSWTSEQTDRTIADGLRVPGVGVLNWQHILRYVDEVVTVSEQAILSAMRRVILGEHLVCEPSGAVAVAAALEYPDLSKAGPAVAVLSGGNVDPALLTAVLGEQLPGSTVQPRPSETAGGKRIC